MNSIRKTETDDYLKKIKKIQEEHLNEIKKIKQEYEGKIENLNF